MNNKSKHTVPIELLSRYLANEANDAERIQAEEWRDASDENKSEFSAFAKLWLLTGDDYKHAEIDVDAEWKHLDRTISKGGRIISLSRIMQIAATVIIVFGLSFLFYNQTQKVSTKTQMAQVQTINLPDGSVVTLNADSKLSYSKNFGKDNRNLSLKGEAFFDVAKNPNMPFIIDAQGASIKVVGTQFNVRAYKHQDKVKVTVVEGVVELYETKEPKKQTVLNAGETGIYMKREKAIKKHARIEINDISWKTYEISFENTSLLRVAEILQNVYHIQFEVADSVKDCAVTVEFNQKDLASVLKVLKSTLDLEITKQGNTIYLKGEGC
ncbi:MAG: FecR domain-containing protein [Salinivirgaceae bacterium]|jgi:transmembrane sensor|nr:FecR domain-containing protein [Salinivirgaceae bacterium]